MVLSTLFRRVEPVLLSPALLALIISILIVAFIPDFFPEYRITLVDSGVIDRVNSEFCFADVDGDGNSEELQAFTNTLGKAAIKITDHQRRVLGHWYFNGILLPRHQRFFTNDLENNGKQRVVVFIQRNDSLFLNGMEFGRRDTFLIRDKFISKVIGREGVYDYQITDCSFADFNHDGTNEVVFSLMAGFPLQPRGIYLYNIREDKFITTSTGGAFFGITEITDINEDSIPEIICAGYAIKNYPDSANIRFHDSTAWLMVFDRQLNFVFQPLGFHGYTSNIFPVFTRLNHTPYLAAVYNHRSIPARSQALYLFHPDGRLAVKKTLTPGQTAAVFDLAVSGPRNNKLFVISPTGEVFQVNEKLDTIATKNFGNPWISRRGEVIDCDQDGTSERLVIDGNHGILAIYKTDYTKPVKLELPFRTNGTITITVKLRCKISPEVYIQAGENFALIRYEKNPLFPVRFLFYLGVFLVVYFFILLIRQLQRMQIRRQLKLQRKIADLQLLLLENQLDPHFTFNAINVISASILQDKPEDANRNLMALSRLMRSCVVHAESLTRTLAEELEFTKNFIELMKGRIDNNFEYVIDIAPDVDLGWQVPKMVTQIYVENAIKHGLKTRGTGGRLEIRVFNDDKSFVLEISDNGIGRQAATPNGTMGTGKGMAIMEQMFALFNRHRDQRISCMVTDLSDDNGASSGTLVRIVIPAGLQYKVLKK